MFKDGLVERRVLVDLHDRRLERLRLKLYRHRIGDYQWLFRADIELRWFLRVYWLDR